ncbi:MAG: ComF family protein [candidate division Zixibacteria bacterium]|nr:ComF family protein [candidate division Zixibacteria bacterium]
MKNLLNSLREKTSYCLDEIFAFISAPACPGCHEYMENPHNPLCDDCRKHLDFSGDGAVCLICKCPEGIACRCRVEKKFNVPRMYYWGLYADVVRELIHQFKFDGHNELGRYLTKIAMDKLYNRMQGISFDYIIPVPMLKKDINNRGFNQTHIIAEDVSERLAIPVEYDILRKVKKTELQANLSASERWTNIADAFAVDDSANLKGRRVLLIDDIVTTGATCCECAKALYAAGVKDVAVFALISNNRGSRSISNRI